MKSSSAGPVDDEREWPFNDVVKGKGFEASKGHVCGLSVDDSLLLFGLDGQHTQQLSDDVVRHQVDLNREERHRRK